MTLPLVFFLSVGAYQPLFSPPAQGPQAQEAGAQEEHGGGQRDGCRTGRVPFEGAVSRRKGVIQAAKIGVCRQGRIVIDKNRMGRMGPPTILVT